MKHIQLSRNKVAMVDDQDYDKLSKLKWFARYDGHNFYAVRMNSRTEGKRKLIPMHRVILGLKPGDGLEVDHRNGNGLDNTRVNLRIVTHSENLHNHSGYSTNTSGYTGVSWYKRTEKWQAKITRNNKDIHLGYFKSMGDAVDARVLAEAK